MSKLKTQPSGDSVEAFLNSIANAQRREDCFTVLELMREVTGEEPRMWGDAIVGFGQYHYKYASGREGDWFRVGFAPRKRNLTLYLNYGFDEPAELMERLGKYKTGAACLYVNKLQDVDLEVLRELIKRSAESTAAD
ncbi:MAG: DUF1801 domain-containing protein [Anaerolineae bacterium]|nr:DUF1801 domain-containing protein [Anaerolineae bacterium]